MSGDGVKVQRLEVAALPRFFGVLHEAGYRTLGPRIKDGAIVLDELLGADELPRGWSDTQEKGHYRLRRSNTPAFFGFNLGPDSWKKFITPKRQLLWRAERGDDGLKIAAPMLPATAPLAFIGVRACEQQALAIQERVREVSGLGAACAPEIQPLLVGVTCSQAAATCFCTSMGTGPRFAPGFDLLLTELDATGDHHFLVGAGSERGAGLLAKLATQPVSVDVAARIDEQLEQTSAAIVRRMTVADPARFFANTLEHARWDDVASRCLSCANCTLVCPTCFCTTVEDTSDVTGAIAERWLTWDSCFTLDFSYLHGGSVRQTTRSRYRQWLTHKLGTWHEQFGSSGCVGCGRCIAWCPVGIDLTEEVRALAQGAPREDH